MKNFEVIEYRGCNFEYSVFQGSREECEQWLKENCFQDVELMGGVHWVSNDPECKNGNGFYFKYYIREISE